MGKVALSFMTLKVSALSFPVPLVVERGVRLAVTTLTALLSMFLTSVLWLVVDCRGGPTPKWLLLRKPSLLSIRQRGLAL